MKTLGQFCVEINTTDYKAMGMARLRLD